VLSEEGGDKSRTLKAKFSAGTDENRRPNGEDMRGGDGDEEGGEERGEVSWRFEAAGKRQKHPERYSASLRDSHTPPVTATATASAASATTGGRGRYPTSLAASSSRPAEYFLPTRGNIHHRKRQRNGNSTGTGSEPYTVSEAEVIREFAKLDLSGEGKLTFLTVKSAMELMNASGSSASSDNDDVVIRAWLRDHDRGGKGYIDMADFMRIFSAVLSDTIGSGEGRYAFFNSHEFGTGAAGGSEEQHFASLRERDDRVNRLKT
jgi:hypothetical protein